MAFAAERAGRHHYISHGNIAQQLGGDKVSVTSILSDPNVDPHEYESDVQDGIAITNANIVIENGLEYDTWMDKLLSASPNPNRIVITAGAIAPDRCRKIRTCGMASIIFPRSPARSTSALVKTDPADAALFKSNLAAFNASLAPITAKMSEIKVAICRHAGGTHRDDLSLSDRTDGAQCAHAVQF